MVTQTKQMYSCALALFLWVLIITIIDCLMPVAISEHSGYIWARKTQTVRKMLVLICPFCQLESQSKGLCSSAFMEIQHHAFKARISFTPLHNTVCTPVIPDCPLSLYTVSPTHSLNLRGCPYHCCNCNLYWACNSSFPPIILIHLCHSSHILFLLSNFQRRDLSLPVEI